MELSNFTRMVVGYTLGMEPDGRESLVVVVKGTFRIPAESGARLQLDEEQLPLVSSDVFFGEPGGSAPRYEVDFAPRKQYCDVLLNGHAYAPGGRPTERVTVGLGVGGWSKSFSVVGNRVWFTAGGPRATAPEPFTRMSLSYDCAFGGADLRHEDPALHVAFKANPSGRGFHKHLRREWLEGSALPNTEELGTEVQRPDGNYRPMSFGIVGRHWEPRYRLAGTYDQHWLDEVAPFLPADFDARYYQAAPPDQQLALPLGEQSVSLLNLTPDGQRQFTLPHFEAPIHVFPKRGDREDLVAPLDTLLIEPDLERVTMTWRVARELKKNLFEIAQVMVGRKGAEWWQQRDSVAFPIPIVVEPMGDSGAAGIMSASRLAILNTGVVSAVGLRAPAACAAIRAKLTNPTETRFVDSDGEWIMACRVPLEAPGTGVATKLSAMAAMAIEECLSGVPRRQWPAVPLLLCVAEQSRPGRMQGLDDRLADLVAEQLGVRWSDQSAVIAQGRASIGMALRRARELVYESHAPFVVIAGADSLLTWPQLQVLEQNGRLLTASNSNGFIPGEAAGAVLIGRPAGEPQLVCTGLGFGVEKATIESEEPLRADGLVQAFRAALEEAGCALHELDLRITDVSGEQYYFKEAALALGRVMRQRKEEFDIWHAAECTGEIGAAAGPVALAVADAACRKAYAPGPNILLHASNDGGERARRDSQLRGTVMANEVYANMMEVSCKAGVGKSTCAFPDVCFTPPPAPAPGVPVPYPNTGMDDDTAEGTRTVQISGQEAMIKNKSYFAKSTGDEAGCAPKKGQITGTNTGKVYFNAWSMNVLFEGENVVRNLDLTTHNHASFPGNTPPWPYLSKTSVANPNGVCAEEVNNINSKCKPGEDPCAGLGGKPSRRKASPEAPLLADKTAANDCLAARRCALQTYIPNTCCPPQTPHHLIEASALFDIGRGGEGSTPLMGVRNYNEHKAPCVCAEGPTQHVGTHGLMHTFQSAVAAKCPTGDLPLAPKGMLKGVKWTTYRDAKASAFKAMQKVFPDSKCSQKCIEAQLDNYHRQCGIKEHTRIKAVEEGQTDLTAAEDAVAARAERVKVLRAGGSGSGAAV